MRKLVSLGAVGALLFLGERAHATSVLELPDSGSEQMGRGGPSIALGAEVLDGVRFGAGFVWGIARFKLQNSAASVNGDNQSPAENDAKATLQVKDYFIPGFVLGGLFSASEEIDLAAWYKWSAPIDASGYLLTDASYFTPSVKAGDKSRVKSTDTSDPG